MRAIGVSGVYLERAACGVSLEDAGGDQRLHLPSLVSRGTGETAGVRVKSWQFQLAFSNGRELNLFFFFFFLVKRKTK